MTKDNLPPGPYEYMTTAPLDGHHGMGHVYLVDANGRKIASIWGKPDEKLALVDSIIRTSGGDPVDRTAFTANAARDRALEEVRKVPNFRTGKMEPVE